MDTTMPAQVVRDLVDAHDRIRELEEDVRRLKVELAKRPAITTAGFNSRPFTPVPKKGH